MTHFDSTGAAAVSATEATAGVGVVAVIAGAEAACAADVMTSNKKSDDRKVSSPKSCIVDLWSSVMRIIFRIVFDSVVQSLPMGAETSAVVDSGEDVALEAVEAEALKGAGAGAGAVDSWM